MEAVRGAQREPSQGGARRSPAKGFELRRLRCKPKADVDSAAPPSSFEEEKKQRHSRGEMRSEHNRGASLGAFLLAVSTVTLLMVSPVEGQVGQPCVVTAFPGEPEACQGDLLFCDTGTCEECSPVGQLSECEVQFASNGPDQVANCQRECFDYYACATNADCPDFWPLCTNGQCGECEVSALPGAAGSCPDIPVGGTLPGPQLCVRTATEAATPICIQCAGLYQFEGITTAADCELLELETTSDQNADVVANCQRQCFDYYVCDTNADCPDTLPFCNLPQGATEGECSSNCVVTAFPGEPGSCGGDELCNIGIDAGNCEACPTSITLDDCETVFAGYGADQIANCQRSCFNFYACATNADCPDTLPFCNLPQGATEGECVATDPSECVVSVFPGETGSCPDPDEACIRTTTTAPKTVCVPCTLFEQDFGITTTADCGFLENPPANQTADVVANCQRECFGFYACTSEADCPADRPLCDAGQCLAECGTNADCTVNRPLCNAGQCLAGCGTNADCPADRPLCIAGQCVVSSVPSSPPSSPTSSPKSSPLDGMGGGS